VDFLDQLKEVSSKDQDLDWANLCYYWEKNEQLIQSPDSKGRIVFMGDSITEEWGRLSPDFFQSNDYVNRGIGGQTTPQMLLRFKQDVININPAIVFILAGTNDIAGNTGPANLNMITNNIFSMAELSISYNIKVVLSSILPVDRYPWANHIKEVPETISKINQKVKSFSQKHSIIYLDYYSSMLGQNRGLKKDYTTDGVHLNKKGYKVMSDLVQDVIRKESFTWSQ